MEHDTQDGSKITIPWEEFAEKYLPKEVYRRLRAVIEETNSLDDHQRESTTDPQVTRPA